MPERAHIVDLGGQYVVPGLINAHGHVGVANGLEKGPEVDSAALVRRQLKRYARHGVTSVVSLGGEPPEAFDVRDAQGAAPGRARLFLSGPVIPNGPEDEVRAQVRRQAARGADWTKLRVDDNLGRGKKMPPALYAAIAEASHAQGVPLAAHIVELSDAKGVLRANADLLAHSVRDAPVDEELIGLMRSGGGHCITPTLTREVSTYIYAERPDFFDDPFFRETADPAVIEQLQQPEVQKEYTGRAADYYREALPVATDNMMRLYEAGVHVAMGTDSGQSGRFQGYFEHMEMGMMQEAGMTPKDVLRSATGRAHLLHGLVAYIASQPAFETPSFVLRLAALTRNRREQPAESPVPAHFGAGKAGAPGEGAQLVAAVAAQHGERRVVGKHRRGRSKPGKRADAVVRQRVAVQVVDDEAVLRHAVHTAQEAHGVGPVEVVHEKRCVRHVEGVVLEGERQRIALLHADARAEPGGQAAAQRCAGHLHRHRVGVHGRHLQVRAASVGPADEMLRVVGHTGAQIQHTQAARAAQQRHQRSARSRVTAQPAVDEAKLLQRAGKARVRNGKVVHPLLIGRDARGKVRHSGR